MLVINTRNRLSERNRLPQKLAPITIDHSITDEPKRRRKVCERERGAGGAGVSDIQERLTTRGAIANFQFLTRNKKAAPVPGAAEISHAHGAGGGVANPAPPIHR